MTWGDALLIALACVDLAALAVGLTILRRVTAIVVETGETIHQAVASSIDEAKRDAVIQFSAAVGPALAAFAHEVPRVVREAVGNLHFSAGGQVVVAPDICTGDVHIGGCDGMCTSPDGGSQT